MMDYEADRRLSARMSKLRRHGRWIFEASAALAAAALLVSLLSHKIYRATTYLVVSESKIGSGSGDTSWQQAALLPTFIPFVDNDALIREALRKFHLDRPPYKLTVYRFRRNGYLDVQIPKSTRLLELRVEFPNAELAAGLANDLAGRAVEFNERMNASDADATRRFLKAELARAQERLAGAAAERVSVQQAARMEDRDKELGILLAEKDRLSTRLEQLRLELAQDQSKTTTLEQALRSQPRTYLLKKSVMADRFLEHAAEQLKLSGQPLSMTEESLNTTRQDIQKNLVRARVDAAAERAGMETAEAGLARVDQQVVTLLARLTSLRSQLENADQEYSLAAEAVKTASREYQNASFMVSSKSQDLKQLAPAVVPERPIRPRIVLNTLLGFLFGLLLFSALALILENLREMRLEERFPVADGERAAVQR